jgi:DNA repair photolyase
MIIREIEAKDILSKSQIHDYTLNAHVGCSHNCRYCHATFMKRFSGHKESRGSFIDAKINCTKVRTLRHAVFDEFVLPHQRYRYGTSRAV